MAIDDMWIENDYVKPGDNRDVLVAYTDNGGNKTTTVAHYQPDTGWLNDKNKAVPNVEWWKDLPMHPDFNR